jgi:S1-C subfamily serine protease
MGHKMITKGIVSSPNKDKKGSFLTDAPFNRGFSGGAVLAIRDGVPNFELVGLAKSVSAISSYVLTPSKEYDQSLYDPGTPYTGDVFVDQKTDIRYGITSVISTETIKEFFDRNEQAFKDKGYDFKYLFGK